VIIDLADFGDELARPLRCLVLFILQDSNVMVDAFPRGGNCSEDGYRGPTINTVTSGETGSLIYLQTLANRSKSQLERILIDADDESAFWPPHSMSDEPGLPPIALTPLPTKMGKFKSRRVRADRITLTTRPRNLGTFRHHCMYRRAIPSRSCFHDCKGMDGMLRLLLRSKNRPRHHCH
jgi:hypothetical protein